jgi:hypothetical protein
MFRKIAIGLVLAALFAGCAQICSYVPIPGVCSASPSASPTP